MTTIKQRILKERGLVRVDKRNRKRNSFEGHRIAPKAIIAGKGKTPLMRYLEQKYNVAIEEALVSGSLSVVAKKFGNEVDVSTLSRWITRFKLRYTATNLPVCEGCQHATPACNGGVCHILMELEEWDLMLLKRQQILDGTKPL
jgi:hypothetical protein